MNGKQFSRGGVITNHPIGTAQDFPTGFFGNSFLLADIDKYLYIETSYLHPTPRGSNPKRGGGGVLKTYHTPKGYSQNIRHPTQSHHAHR